MVRILSALFNSAYPIISKTGVSWKIMDTYGYDGEDFCQKVDSMDFAFDVLSTEGEGYLGFVREVLNIFDDLYNRNISVAGILALRYTRNTNALIGMTKFPITCHIEISILKNFAGNMEFLERVQRLALGFKGVPSWGQLMNTYTALDIRNLHGDNLTTWRRTLTHLIRNGEGSKDFTFSNNFTLNYNLEPLDPSLTLIKQLNIEIEIGRDGIRGQDVAGTSHLLGDLHHIREGIAVIEVIEFNNIGTRDNPNWRGWGQGIHNKEFIFSQPIIIADINRLFMYMPAAGGGAGDNADINGVIVRAISIDDTECLIGRTSGSFRLTGNNEGFEILFNGCMP